jgi:hypothetical protein
MNVQIRNGFVVKRVLGNLAWKVQTTGEGARLPLSVVLEKKMTDGFVPGLSFLVVLVPKDQVQTVPVVGQFKSVSRSEAGVVGEGS